MFTQNHDQIQGIPPHDPRGKLVRKANGRVLGMGDLGYYDSQTLLMVAAKSHQEPWTSCPPFECDKGGMKG